MLCNNTWARNSICLYVILSFTFTVHSTLGYAGADRRRQDGAETSRQEELRQEAQSSAAEISSALTQILQAVNQNRKPEPDLIEQSASMLLENRRYASAYDDAQKAQYMLLQAWTYYYQGEGGDAMNWALRACRTDETSGDAWISQALFCQLNGKRPLEPRIPRTTPRQNETNRRGRQRRGNEMEDNVSASAAQPYGRKGTLTFDVSALRPDILRERLTRLELQATSGSKLTYTPGENTLSMLVWQVDPIGDANDIASVRPAVPMIRDRMNGMGSQDSQKLSLDSQQTYFNNLYSICKDVPRITSLQMNTNDLQTAQAAQANADTSAANAAPVVLAAAPSSGAQAFVGTQAQVPFMMIADNEGIVRYAGPAADFMPAFILTHLTDVEIPVNTSGQIDVQTNNAPTTVNTPARIRENVRQRPNQQREAMTREMLQQRMNRNAPARTRPAVDPNQPAADPNTVSSAPSIQQTQPASPVEMTLENQVEADKLLALAQMEIKASRTLRGKSPEKGIEACKEILEKYPGTEYAQQARDWLQKVPQQYWEKYEIADLLGY